MLPSFLCLVYVILDDQQISRMPMPTFNLCRLYFGRPLTYATCWQTIRILDRNSNKFNSTYMVNHMFGITKPCTHARTSLTHSLIWFHFTLFIVLKISTYIHTWHMWYWYLHDIIILVLWYIRIYCRTIRVYQIRPHTYSIQTITHIIIDMIYIFIHSTV